MEEKQKNFTYQRGKKSYDYNTTYNGEQQRNYLIT